MHLAGGCGRVHGEGKKGPVALSLATGSLDGARSESVSPRGASGEWELFPAATRPVVSWGTGKGPRTCA